MELEITWGRAIRVWWAFTCRALVAALAMKLVAVMVDFGMGLILGPMGCSPHVIGLLSVVICLGMTLALSIACMKMILGQSFGEFRLVLLREAPLVADTPRI
jgi:hypothetical protein